MATVTVDLAAIGNAGSFDKVTLLLSRQDDGAWKVENICDPDLAGSLANAIINRDAPDNKEESEEYEANDEPEPAPAEPAKPDIGNNLIITTGQIIAKSGVNLRESPSVNGKKLGMLKQNTEVIILAQDGPLEEIEGITANWFSILVNKDLTGWLFGGFIGNIKENVLPGKVPEEIRQFTVDFFSDSSFQRKHIRFPLKILTEDTDGNEVTMLSADNYEQPFTFGNGEAVDTDFTQPATDSFALRIRGKECGILIYYIFKTLENKIFLVEIRDYST